MLTRKHLLLALALALSALQSQPPGLCAAVFEEGVDHFNTGRWTHAARCFQQHILAAPRDPHGYYYLANCLVHLNQHEKAIEAFQVCYCLDPYGTLSGFCRKALKAYRAPVPDAEDTQAQQAGASKGGSASTSGRTDHTIANIRRQATEIKERHRVANGNLAESARKVAEQQASIIREETSAEAERALREPPTIQTRGGVITAPYNPELQKARAEEIRRSGEERAKWVQERAEEKSNEYKKAAQDKAQLLDEIATNLESQLKSKSNVRGSSQLNSVGTGLFVRYYGVPSKTPPVEVHQSVGRIVDHPSAYPPAEYTPPKEKPSGTVTGKVLEK